MFLQSGGTGEFWLVKPLTLAAQGTLVVSITLGWENVGANSNAGVGATLIAGTNASVRQRYDHGIPMYVQPPGTNYPSTAGKQIDLNTIVYAIRHSGTQTYQCFAMTECGLIWEAPAASGAYPATSVTLAGANLFVAASKPIFAIHYIRYYPGNTWIAGLP
jgi:hypothetical protein